MDLFFDTETTGFPNFRLPADDPTQPYIVDLAALLCAEDGREVDRFEAIIKPEGWTVSEGAASVHGITTDIASEQGIPIAEALDAFDALVERATQLIAFNLRFDDKLLRGARRRLGRPDGFGTVPVFCCMKAATPLCKLPATARMHKAGIHGFKTPNLAEALRLLCDRDHVGAHRAMADVIATKEIYLAMRGEPEFMAAGRAFHTNSEGTRAGAALQLRLPEGPDGGEAA